MNVNRPRIAGSVLLVLLLLPAALSGPNTVADVNSNEGLGMAGFSAATGEDGRAVTTLFSSQAALRDVDPGVVLVPGVPETLSSGETGALEDHLASGAALWLLDETNNAGPLTREAGIEVTPDPLLDPESPFDDPIFVEAEAQLGNETYQLILSRPTLLEVNETRATVVARSVPAFRDVDRSGSIEASDPSGRHPVIAQASIEGAPLLVASDAGLFTNTVLQAEAYDNDALLAALLAQAPDGDVVVDASRHDAQRWLAPLKVTTAGLLRATTDPIGATLIGLATIGLTVAFARRAPDHEAWGEHEYDIGAPLPPDPEDQQGRLRRLLIYVLHDETGVEAADLLAYSDDQLEELAREHLGGTGEYLRGKAGIEERYRSLIPFVEPGGVSE